MLYALSNYLLHWKSVGISAFIHFYGLSLSWLDLIIFIVVVMFITNSEAYVFFRLFNLEQILQILLVSVYSFIPLHCCFHFATVLTCFPFSFYVPSYPYDSLHMKRESELQICSLDDTFVFLLCVPVVIQVWTLFWASAEFQDNLCLQSGARITSSSREKDLEMIGKKMCEWNLLLLPLSSLDIGLCNYLSCFKYSFFISHWCGRISTQQRQAIITNEWNTIF